MQVRVLSFPDCSYSIPPGPRFACAGAPARLRFVITPFQVEDYINYQIPRVKTLGCHMPAFQAVTGTNGATYDSLAGLAHQTFGLGIKGLLN